MAHPNLDGCKDLKLARALATLTFEVFSTIIWGICKSSFRDCLDQFDSFKEEVFVAMAHFVWNIYDEEDIENIAFTDDIFDECERIWKLVCLKGNFEVDSSLIDMTKYEKVREQDVWNILKWCNKNKSANIDELKNFSNFKRKVLLHRILLPYYQTGFEKYVMKARDVMLASDNLDPKGPVKHQLRMELIDRECFCIVDALYMQSWKRINFLKFEAATSNREGFEDMVTCVHHMFYELASIRLERLHKCKSLVTYPLSGNVFGSWDSEVRKVIKYADMKRRSEGRRFIGTDHFIFYLHRMKVFDSGNKLKQLQTHAKKHNEDTVYHLYRKANKIATERGHQTVHLAHLCAAIMSSADDDQNSWKKSVECVRRAKAKRKGKKHKEVGEAHVNLWTGLEDSESETRREINGNVADVVKKIIMDDDLQTRASNILSKGPDEPRRSEGRNSR